MRLNTSRIGIIVFVLLSSCVSFAKNNIKIEILYGRNSNTIDGYFKESDQVPHKGYSYSINLERMINNMFSFQTGIGLSHRGADDRWKGGLYGGSTIEMKWLELPINLKYEVFRSANISPHIFGGVSISYFLSGSSQQGCIFSESNRKYATDLNALINCGVGVIILKRVVVKYEYSQSLNNVYQDYMQYSDSTIMKTNSIKFGFILIK